MGKTKKRYLVNRILAMILAVAMSVTMVPSTALAAPADDSAVEGIANDVATGGSDDANANKDTGSDDADTNNDTDGDEADANKGAGDEADANKGAGDDVDANKDADGNAADENKDADGEKTDVQANDTPAVKPVYTISLDADFVSKAEYDSSSHFTDIMDYVYLYKDGEEITDSTEKAKVIPVWKVKGADGNYGALTGMPKDAGSYQAVLTYPAAEGVHDGAEKTVDCEITKAPVTITLEGLNYDGKKSVMPGTKRNAVTTPVINSVAGGGNEIEKADLTLTMEIKDAVEGTVLGADAVLKQGGDYTMVLTPAFVEAKKAVFEKNYELKPFTADIEMEDSISTRITVTLTDKHKQEGEAAATQITKEYSGTAVADPKEGAAEDYTVKVEYYNEAAGDYQELTKEIAGEDIKVTGEWATYSGCEVDETGKVKAPTNAGTYYYNVVYAGKDGVYAGNQTYITVEITKVELTIEPVLADASATTLTVAADMTVSEVLSKIGYKVLHKKADGTDEDVKDAVKAKHIWGTSYYGTSKSQIYEPMFTLQESTDNGATWTDISARSINSKISTEKKYRITYTGRKAIFNADGSSGYYDVIEDINSTNHDSINGVDTNYHTGTALTAGKELAVTVTPGTKAVIDVNPLIGEGKGAKTITELTPKQYDGEAIYPSRSAYKNLVKLKDANGTVIRTEQREFTYTWARYEGSFDDNYNWHDDLVDAKIVEKNGGTLSWDAERMSNMVSPRSAGVYKLTISYEDKIDPGTYNYADPVTLYFAIDPRQVKIEPTEASYEVLQDRSIWDFFYEGEKKIEYTVTPVEGTLPRENVVARGQIVKKTAAVGDTPESAEVYDQDFGEDYLRNVWFEKKDGVSYELQGCELRYYDEYSRTYYGDSNYTCVDSKVVMNGTTAEREDTFLNTVTKPVNVTAFGDQTVTITVADATKWEAKEKVYDAKPFAVTDLIKDGLLSVKKADGTDVTGLNLKYVVPYTDEDGNQTDRELKEIVDAGSYDLYVRFDGSKDYQPNGWDDNKAYPANLGVKLGTFKITQKEIALTADLEKSYPAGTYVSEILSEVSSRYQVTGYVQGQEDAFAYKDEGYYLKAWTDHYGSSYGPYFYVTEKGSNTPLNDWERLKRNKAYEVRYGMDSDGNSCSLVETATHEDGNPCWDTVNDVAIRPAVDYKVKKDAVAEFTVKPGNSDIESVRYAGSNWSGTPYRVAIQPIAIQVQNDETDPMKREVTMTEAIGWSRVKLDGEIKEGNFVAFAFTPPAEYDGSLPDTAMYKNAIKAAGGYVGNDDPYTFIAVFDAGKGDTTFKIRWEDGYVETYTLKFKDAVKLANLEDAVAPKALAFNAADKKMAVGQTQQLDMKITKEQMGDVIYLGYKSETPDTLAVNQHGAVTALKMGQGTITVFAQHLVNGKAEPILDAKGKYAKSAQLKINVTKLDAPKKVKATAHGNYIELNYDTPAYGYRREIYVMEKNSSYKTPTQFDQLLAGMKENQWQEKGFAIAPVYITKWDENNNRNNYKYARKLTGLNVKKDYTIYVRNVCAVRTLDSAWGGGAVTQAAMNESAAGVVLNVKTKKAEVLDLSLSFYDRNAWVYNENGDHVVQYSKLKNGTIECWTEGAFPELYGDNKDDIYKKGTRTDGKWIKLPLGKDDKNDYEEPKLVYELADCYDKKTGTRGWGTKNDYASIDKKGKIKITGFSNEYDGICEICVRVRDTVTGENATAYLPLMFEEADSVKAAKGSVTLSVGQREYLQNLLTYNFGKTKLTAYPNRSLDLVKVRNAIREQGKEDYFTADEYGGLTAIKGGGTLTLQLTDKNVERKSGTDKATVKVTIKSKDLELVKNLKVRDVTHNTFGLTFSYNGGADSFLLEVSDAKKPIYSKVITKYDGYISQLLATDKDGRYVPVYDADGDWDQWQRVKDTYEIPDWAITDLGIRLTKDSQYTVSLTPIYNGNKAAKATSTKVKTTKIPAVDGYLKNDDSLEENEYDEDDTVWGCNKRGGMPITVSEGSRSLNDSNTSLAIVSGNTYTLTADVQYNRGRVNDTLVWSVGDAKVATVKAAAGTYCITLKGMKPGTTKLEVRSKLLGNKVIARYDIYVSPVGDAYNSFKFYGENEPN